jgi:hypothetical protein
LDELYKTQLKTEDLIASLQEFVRIYGEGEVLCDPSSPETIDALRRAGLNATGYHAKREDGIREMGGRFAKAGDGKPRLFISSRCVNLVAELLEWKEDVKENDHACLIAGTVVMTDRGQIPIEDIRESDRVWTRKGFRQVVAGGRTGFQDVIEVCFDDGSSLVGTPSHPVFVIGKGFTRIDALRYAYKCETLDCLSCGNISKSREKSRNSTDESTTAILTARGLMCGNTSGQTGSMEPLATCIEMSGNSITGLFRKDIASIIKTAIPRTIRLRTFSVFLTKHICRFMGKSSSLIQNMQKNRANTLREFGLSQNLGMLQKKAAGGIVNNGSDLSGSLSRASRKPAKYVVPNSSISLFNRAENSARISVRPKRCVSVEKWRSKQPVYNLEIEGASEFYANGILVHNCDALRYALKLGATDEVTRARFLPFRR